VHHAEDELFIILEGQGTYRFGDANYEVAAGDVLGAPRGGSGYAHKLINSGTVPLRYVAISSRARIDVCEYPDSGKFMVRSDAADEESQRFVYIGRAEDTLEYWDGEAGS
jgi:uncharacterized cupin superfamily protein